MIKESKWVMGAGALLLIVLFVIAAVFVSQYRKPIQSQTQLNSNVSPKPEGLVVVASGPTDEVTPAVMINFVDPHGESVRTRRILNASAVNSEFQLVKDDLFVYTVVGIEPGLRRMNEGGSLSSSADIHAGLSGPHFWLVSPDEQLIAWSETSFVAGQSTSLLWQAKVDGSEKRLVNSLTAEGEFYFRPVAWIADGFGGWKVSSVRGLQDLGGYQVFSDPLGPLYIGDEFTFDQTQQLSEIESDGTSVFLTHTDKLVIHLNEQHHHLPDAGQAGEGKVSPDHGYVAVAAVKGNPDDEVGWVDIWNVATDSLVKVETEKPHEVFHVVGWLDEYTVALAVLDAEDLYASKVYVVKADGSFFRQIWTGFPVGVVPVQK